METVLYELSFPWKSLIDCFLFMVLLSLSAIVIPYQIKNEDRIKLLNDKEVRYTKVSGKNLTFKNILKRICVLLVTNLLPLIFLFVDIKEYTNLSDILYSNDCQTVEGIVEDFSPMPRGGHASESFEINGVYFEYSQYDGGVAYNDTYYYNGVIKNNGQRLKIAYYQKDDTTRFILRIIEYTVDG